jgi:molybdate transport system substrate-binding protein
VTRAAVLAAVVTLAAVACTSGPERARLTVFAASSLSGAFGTLEREFERANPRVDVRLNVGGSSRLAEQIAEGAPADVFAAADEKSMATAADAGLAGDPRVFATNTLTIAVAPGNPEGIERLDDLAAGELVVVTCAAEVPCGRAAAAVSAQAGVQLRPASEEPDVKSVLAKVTAGEADAGLVYVTDVRAARGKAEAVDIPEAAAARNRYPIAVLRESENGTPAERFASYVLGDGQRVLEQAGFGAP